MGRIGSMFRRVASWLTPLSVYAEMQGAADGRELIPADDDPNPPGWIGALQAHFREQAERLNQATLGQEGRLVAHRETGKAALLEARQHAEALKDAAATSRARLATVTAKAAALDADLNPPTHWYWPAWACVIALGILTLLDAPLVFMAFQAFGLNAINTLLLATLAAVLTTSVGHFLGEACRRERVSGKVILRGLLGLALVVSLAIAFLRESALEVLKSDVAIINPWSSAGGLLVVSLGSMAVAMMLTFHQRVVPLRDQVSEARRQLSAEEMALRKALARQRVLAKNLVNCETRLGLLQRRLRHRLGALDARLHRILGLYVAANVAARDPHRVPPSLSALREFHPKTEEGQHV